VRLVTTFSENSVPYMVIGGMANAVWVEGEEIGSVVALLTGLYHCRVSDPEAFVGQTRVAP
jgi:hypothetical protein